MKYCSILFCLLFASMLQAQNPGCDGLRYKNDVFTTVKKTTIQYAPSINHQGQPIMLAMDVYEPEGDITAKRPVVVLAHGGSFIYGDKANLEKSCILLAKKGYIAATINYRLYPFFLLGLPDSLDIFDTAVKAVADFRASVRYFREDAVTANLFRADADNIFIGGYSAGAVAALHTAYLDETDAIPTFLQEFIQTNGGWVGNSGTVSNQTFSASAKAVINMSGGIYRSEWVTAGGIPLVSIHGDADATVPYVSGLAAGIAYLEGSSLIHAQALSVGMSSSLLTVPGGGHTNIYDQAQYAPQLAEFWVQATTLLESLTCALVSTQDVTVSAAAWSLAPNPASTQFSIKLPQGLQRAGVTIYNLQGQQLIQLQNIDNQSAISIEILPKGIYIVTVSDENEPGKKFESRLLIRA